MHTGFKIALAGLGLGGGALGIGYLVFLQKLKDVVVNIEPSLDSASIEKINLNVKFVVKNPSSQTITVAQPFVNITYNGFSLFSSTLTGKKETIAANSEASFDVPVEIKILNTLTPLTLLGNAIIQKKEFSLQLDTRLTFTGMWPYRKSVSKKIDLPVYKPKATNTTKALLN